MGLLVPGKHKYNAPRTNRNLLLSCQFSAKKVKLCAETHGVVSLCHTSVFQRKARESRRNRELVERGTCNIAFVYLTFYFFCCSFVTVFRRRNLCLQIVFFSAYTQAATVKCYWDHKGQHKEIMEFKEFFGDGGNLHHVSQSMRC